MRADLERIVWETECHPSIRSWKFTLLNLCHHANSSGEAYPSVATVARETGYSQKAVIDALAGLESLGIVRRTGGCGTKNRVAVYSLDGVETCVRGLAKHEVSSPLKAVGDPAKHEVSSPLKTVHNSAKHEMSSCSQLFKHEVSSKNGGFNSELSSPNSEVSSGRSILGIKEVSKLVSGGGKHELISGFVDNSQSAGGKEGTPAASGSPDYKALVKTPGWKPRTDPDRRYCMYHCYTLGASREQAERFIRYNAVRRWANAEFATINDLAKEWIGNWASDRPDEYDAERRRRRKASATRTLT